jgi:hypothetical protein
MKIKSRYSKCLALSLLTHFMSGQVLAAATIPSPYPVYTSAANIAPGRQVPMEALWLHLNANHVGNAIIPRSFDMSGYWPYMAANNPDYKNYLHSHDNGTCVVASDHSNDATIERAMQQQGLDIYDGAIWQIALSLAAKNNPVEYIQDVNSYTDFLMNGVAGGFVSYYGFKDYTYNGKTMPSAKNAYLLKFISPAWASNHDSINDCNMQWPEWSAVTGEEAWAALIGPIQSIYILNDGAHNSEWSSPSQAGNYIQLGKNALGAIKQMQAPSGGIYRDVTLPGQSQDLTISLENNFSLYAGLSMLEEALKGRVKIWHTKLNSLTTANNHKATAQINKLQEDIRSDQDDIDTINSIKKSMVQFFAGQGGVAVFDKAGKYFYASVTATTSDAKNFAVDVQTWGATVIATTKKDPQDENDPDLLQTMIHTYGNDVMYDMLEAAITKSAYNDSNNSLSGVGYTAQTATDDFYELSGEWTLGAINAAIVLADYYQADADKSTILIAQAKKMNAGLIAEVSSLEGNASSATARLSYLYANKRAFIPFGWYSNKASATASTGWSLMVNSCFNPLELGGGHHQAICQQL